MNSQAERQLAKRLDGTVLAVRLPISEYGCIAAKI